MRQPSLCSLILAAFTLAAAGGAAAAPEPGALRARLPSGATLELPLRTTAYRVEVSGTWAHVELRQVYENTSASRLEAVYSLPMPADAAVHAMFFRIGDRIVHGVVKEREEARRTYEEAKDEGRTAALLEQERDNLFTQSLANVPPGERVVVMLRWVQEVPYDEGVHELVLPTTVGPRYVPGEPVPPAWDSGLGLLPDTDRVPDASRISHPTLAPGQRSGRDLAVAVRLLAGVSPGDVSSPSHAISVEREGGGALARLSPEDGIPNRDFVLRYRVADATPGVRFRLAAQRTGEGGFAALTLQPPATVAAADVPPRELVFVLDCSGSMSGDPMDKARAVVERALSGARPGDTFQIVRFSDQASGLGPAPLPVTAASVARGMEYLQTLHGGGGTEMLSGIRAALGSPGDRGRLRIVMFLTDGYIGNETEILAEVQRRIGPARLFSFGVGSSVNRYLLDRLAEVGRGAVEYVLPGDDTEAAVDRFYRRIDAPVLTDVRIDWGGLAIEDPLPRPVPDLFAGQPLVLVTRYVRPGKGVVRVRGLLGGKPFERGIPVHLPEKIGENPALPVVWARREVHRLSLLDPAQPSPDTHERIVALGVRYGLATQYTSFVAVERRLRADLGLPLATVLIPNEMPDGVTFDSLLEGPADASVLPNRVKPGDPEVRVAAPPGSRVVVRLPWGEEKEAVPESGHGGVYATRFLVPLDAADGTYHAEIEVRTPDGELRIRRARFTVDTTPPVVIALAEPRSAAPGETVRLRLKPTADLLRVARDILGGASPSEVVERLKSETDVREIALLGPDGEEILARQEPGVTGFYIAEVTGPADAAPGVLTLEVAASDLAGNVGRSRLDLEITGPVPGPSLAGLAPGGGALLLLLLAALTIALAAWERRVRGR